MLCPRWNRKSQPVMSQTGIVSVFALFFPGSPTAITWTIVLVVIGAFYRQALRLLSHISEKVFKLLPPIANFNSLRSVVAIIYLFRIVAAIFHAAPCSIGLCFRHGVGREYFTHGLPQNTSAAFCTRLAQKITGIKRSLSSAIATTPPQVMARRTNPIVGENFEASETPSKQIMKMFRTSHICTLAEVTYSRNR